MDAHSLRSLLEKAFSYWNRPERSWPIRKFTWGFRAPDKVAPEPKTWQPVGGEKLELKYDPLTMALWVDFDSHRKEVLLIDAKNYQSYAWYCDSRIYIVSVNAFGMIADRMRIYFQSDADRADFVSSMPECFRNRLMLDPSAPKHSGAAVVETRGCEGMQAALESEGTGRTTALTVPAQKRISKKTVCTRQGDSDAEWQANGDESASEDEDAYDEYDSLDEEAGSHVGSGPGGVQQQKSEGRSAEENGARPKKRRRVMSRKHQEALICHTLIESHPGGCPYDILEMAMEEIADEVHTFGKDSTVSGSEVIIVNGIPVTHSDPGRNASHSGPKSLGPQSAPNASHANAISRPLKGRNGRKRAQKEVATQVHAQKASTYTSSFAAKPQPKNRKLFVLPAPTEPIAKARSRRRSAVAAIDWFKTLGGECTPEPPRTLLNSVKPGNSLPISRTTSIKPNEPSVIQPLVDRVDAKEGPHPVEETTDVTASPNDCSLRLDHAVQTPVMHDVKKTQVPQADHEAVAAAESLSIVTHSWNVDNDAALHTTYDAY